MMTEEAARDRWTAIVTASARGEPIAPEDEAFRIEYERANPDALAEAELWAELGGLGAPRGDAEMSDAAMLAGVLAKAKKPVATPMNVPVAPPANDGVARENGGKVRTRPGMRRGVAGGIAAATLAAAMLAAFAAELIGGPREPAPAPSVAPTASVGHAAPGHRGERPANAPEETTIDAGNAPEGAAVNGSPEGKGSAAEERAPAVAGNASSTIAKAAPPSAPLAANGRPVISGGSAPAKVAPPASPRGAAPAESAASPDALLRRAQALLADGRTQEALEVYRDLIARHPSSAEGRAVMVSLGQILLAGGNAAEALGYFDRYLAAGGPLSLEARYGRIQALRRLGRAADERAAIDELLARHGDSVYAARLRARAEALETH